MSSFSLGVAALLLLMLSKPAHACSKCILASVDRLIPPVGLWCLLAIVAYLATPVFFAASRSRPPGVPTLPTALLTVMGCVLLGAGVLGPLALLPLLIRPIVIAQRCCNWRPPEVSNKAASTTGGSSASPTSPIRFVYMVLSSAALILTCFSLYTRQNRREEEFIVRWAGSGPAMFALRRLQQQEPQESVARQYRYIVRHAGGTTAKEAQERLDALSEQEQDKQGDDDKPKKGKNKSL